VPARAAASRGAAKVSARRRAADPARERRLLRAARAGDRGARERVVAGNLALVRSVASRYRDYGLPLDDLVQEGAVGLLEAIEHYDPGRGPAFDAYARFRVRRAIRNALTDQARLVRLPKRIVERRRALDRAEARLAASGARPTTADLAAATGLSLAAVLEARGATESPVSLDEPVLPDGSPLVALLADPAAGNPETEAEAHARDELLAQAVGRLPERQRRIVRRQWGLAGGPPASATQVARELRVSPRRAQTLGQDALHVLRHTLELAELEP
jgi:RNA polymerase sigma factor (sigma-70 family)